MRTHVSPGVDVLHFLALAVSKEINDVEILESRASGSCMLLASGWSEPAVISFAPDLRGKDSSFGSSRSLRNYT